MTIRVMMIGPFPGSLSQIDGGVAAATTYLAQALSQDPDVELIGVRLAGAGRASGDGEALGWTMESLPLQRFSVSTLFRRQQRELGALMRRHRPDVVHAQGADAAGYLAVRSGMPAIVTIHGILSECARLRTDPVKRVRETAQAWITERFVVERARHVVAISPYVTRHYESRLKGAIHEVPNAVAPTFFDVRPDPQAGRLLFAGRISRGKGLLDLVRAAARERESVGEIVLAGAIQDADFGDELRGEIGRLGLADRVTFAGLLDEESLLREFGRASALLLPSYQETAPMVVQQAMAAGLTVIATRVGGIPDLVEHDRSGLLHDAGDVGGLAGLLRRLRAEPGLGRRLAGEARVAAEAGFSAASVASATKAAYARVIEGTRRTAR